MDRNPLLSEPTEPSAGHVKFWSAAENWTKRHRSAVQLSLFISLLLNLCSLSCWSDHSWGQSSFLWVWITHHHASSCIITCHHVGCKKLQISCRTNLQLLRCHITQRAQQLIQPERSRWFCSWTDVSLLWFGFKKLWFVSAEQTRGQREHIPSGDCCRADWERSPL